MRHLLLLIITSLLAPFSNQFNLDTNHAVVKKGRSRSLFGFSVAQHRTTSGDVIIVAGAPYTTEAAYKQTGAIYRCPMSNSTDDCTRVRFPNATLNRNQHLGVAVAAQHDGRVVTCGNSYNYIKANQFIEKSAAGVWSSQSGRVVSGRCFVLSRDLQPSDELTVDSVETSRDTPETWKDSSMGTSVAFGVGDRLFVGAPGYRKFEGAVVTMDDVGNMSSARTSGSRSEKQVKGTGFFNPQSFLGFAIAASKTDENLVVVAIPHGFPTPCIGFLEPIHMTVKDELICGSTGDFGFGYAIELVDLNADGLDDLVVGAPEYFDAKKDHGGAVYVYSQQVNGTVRRFNEDPVVLFGGLHSRFGKSITSLGDVNSDGFNDIAIGSPGEEAGGAVHIYHGNAALIDGTATQVVRAENFPGRIDGLGHSLSGGLDMDGNGLPDLLIGSLSDHVVVVRSRPVVSVEVVNLTTSSRWVSLESNTTYGVREFELSFCLRYTAAPAAFNSPLNVTYVIALDVLNLQSGVPRVSFNPDSDSSLKVFSRVLRRQQARLCVKEAVYVRGTAVDKLSPIQTNVSVVEIAVLSGKSRRKRSAGAAGVIVDLDGSPVIDMKADNAHVVVVDISKNCGSDNICRSGFQADGRWVSRSDEGEKWSQLIRRNNTDELVLGDDKMQVGVMMTVWNKGEDAHQAAVTVCYPGELVAYQQTFTVGRKRQAAVSCFKDKNSTCVKCEAGNPFLSHRNAASGGNVTFVVVFQVFEKLYGAPELTVTALASTTSEQQAAPKLEIRGRIRIESNVDVYGFLPKGFDKVMGFSGDVIGASAVKRASDVGKLVVHSYQIENTGHTDLRHLAAKLSWPAEMKNSKTLFYLLDIKLRDHANGSLEPAAAAGFRCNKTQINPLGIKYRLTRAKRSIGDDFTTQGSGGAVGSSAMSRRSLRPISEYEDDLSCPGYGGCREVTCQIDWIPKRAKYQVEVWAVVWNSSFVEEYEGFYGTVGVGSHIRLVNERPEAIFSPRSVFTASVSSTVVNDSERVVDNSIDYSLMFFAVIIGLLILAVVVLCCWKIGFFRRKNHEATKFQYHKADSHANAAKAAYENQ